MCSGVRRQLEGVHFKRACDVGELIGAQVSKLQCQVLCSTSTNKLWPPLLAAAEHVQRLCICRWVHMWQTTSATCSAIMTPYQGVCKRLPQQSASQYTMRPWTRCRSMVTLAQLQLRHSIGHSAQFWQYRRKLHEVTVLLCSSAPHLAARLS